jgi:hypothetical protein
LLCAGPHPQWATTGDELPTNAELIRSWRSWESPWAHMPIRRQDAAPIYLRDGTVYAFPVKTLQSGTIYGYDVRPLIIPPEQSCELDTEADWADVERRWRECAKQL